MSSQCSAATHIINLKISLIISSAAVRHYYISTPSTFITERGFKETDHLKIKNTFFSLLPRIGLKVQPVLIPSLSYIASHSGAQGTAWRQAETHEGLMHLQYKAICVSIR